MDLSTVGFYVGYVAMFVLFFAGLYAINRKIVEKISERSQNLDKFKTYVSLAMTFVPLVIWACIGVIGVAGALIIACVGAVYILVRLIRRVRKKPSIDGSELSRDM